MAYGGWYPFGMVKTTLYLPDELKHGLRAVAVRTHRTESELVREAIAQLLRDQPALPDGHWGAGDSGDPTEMTAERVDALLAEGFGQEGLSGR